MYIRPMEVLKFFISRFPGSTVRLRCFHWGKANWPCESYKEAFKVLHVLNNGDSDSIVVAYFILFFLLYHFAAQNRNAWKLYTKL